MPARKRSGNRPVLWRFVWQNAVLRRLLRILGKISLAGCIVCGVLYVVMRAWLFPWLGENSGWVAAKLSSAVGAPVSIDSLEADWAGLRPRLHIGGLTIRSGEHETLRLERVEATLSWMSLPRWVPYFHALEIIGPEIVLERGKDGIFSVAGIRMEPDARERGNPVAWLFGQSRIVVRDATLAWNDALRDAPPLRLTEVQFTFRRGLFSHHLELQGRTPKELATKFEARGDVRRYDSATLDGITGHFYIGLDNADLGGWSAWVDYPFPCKGRGSTRLWLDNDGVGTAGLSADLDLEGVETTLGTGLAPLKFNRLSGRLLMRRAPESVEFGARGLWLESQETKLHTPVDFNLELRNAADGTPNGGAFSASSIDLAALAQLTGSLPLDKLENARVLLGEFNPKGHLRTFSVEWEGEADALQDWKINTEFEGISLTARGLIPGMGNMSGRIKGNNREGEFLFSSQNGYVDLPKVFEQAHIPVARLGVSGSWHHKNGQLAVMLAAVEFVNDDATGWASGGYWPAESGPGEIDISGELSRAQATAVWRYIPIIAGERVRDWLRHSLMHGNVTGAKVRLKGPLAHFPFRDGKGEFSVVARAENGRLDYADGWPALDHLAGELRFTGPGLLIESRGGDIFGVRVEPVRVGIPDLGEGVMTIEGAAKGPSADFLRFIAESPLSARLQGFTESLRPEGNGQLGLKLVLPLHDLSKTEVGGEYRFSGNRVRLDGIAFESALEAAEGSLSFTEDALKALSIRGRLLGGESVIEGKANGGRLELAAHGQVEAAAVYEAFGWPLLRWVNGNTPWNAEMTFGQDSSKIVVRSWLKGLSSRLPSPFAKETDEIWPLEVVTVSQGMGKPRLITAKQGDRLEIALERDASGVVRGGVGLHRPAPISSSNGIQLAASFDKLDIDAWHWTIAAGVSGGQDDEAAPLLTAVMLDARQVRAFGYTFNALQLRAANNAESWTAHLDSTEAQGVIAWKRGGDGVLSAHLSRLALSGDENGAKSDNQDKNGSSRSPPPSGLPGLDVRAEEFVVGTRELGQLKVRATNQEGVWRLDNLSIHHPDAQFSGNGLWQPDAQRSMLDFTLESANVGRLAEVLGYNHIVHDGQAKLAGKLDWRGPPTRIDYPTLSGQIELDAREGRFERIEPGVGRLLGVLSLQALPKRVTLDFRDVFSEGFVFSRIEGKATVSEGVMRSDSIEIAGPAARVLMRGQADIAAETQDLRVTVRPTLSDPVALGAAVVNPLVGAVAYLVQKTFGDPIEKLFSYDYRITGSWVDPVVEKTGSSSPAPKGDGRSGESQKIP
ncbi:MAG: TIGR02099 family protein [Azoarcus sp.]|nr:TIGR02099 family protein [Azoarcus sp.]